MKLTWTIIFAIIGFLFGAIRNTYSSNVSLWTLIQEILGSGPAYAVFILIIGFIIDIIILLINHYRK
jgi:ABC-type microcin C transport system permease subunit YejE